MQSIVALLLFAKASYGAAWDYDDMDGWSHHYSMCGFTDQSPINIQSKYTVHDNSVCDQYSLNWTVDWTQSSFKVVNNGHSIGVIPVERVIADNGDTDSTYLVGTDNNTYTQLVLSENTIGRLQNHFLPDGSAHSEFCLHSFHFHWGQLDEEGSEHWINDEQYPLEVHFVHYSCQHTSIGALDLSAIPEEDGEDKFQLAVVGIMFDITDYDNPAFDAMLPYEVLDYEQYPESGVNTIIHDLDLTDIIPDGVFTDGFYAYEGSLTTPPCTNIVRWHVMNAHSYIGKAQIERFRLLMQSQNKTMGPNYRDPQTNVNTVYACFEKVVEAEEVKTAEIASIWVYTVFITCVMCAFSGICYYRSVKEKRAMMAEPATRATRGRVMSGSSIGTDHRRQSHTQTTDHGAHH